MPKKVIAVVLILILLPTLAFSQMNTASLAIRILKGPLDKAITAAIPGVTNSTPFIDSVILFLEEKPELAGVRFVEGLIVNEVADPEQMVALVKGIRNVAVVSSVALTLAKQDKAADMLGNFAGYLTRSETIKTWETAVRAGDTVRIEGGILVVESQKEAQKVVEANTIATSAAVEAAESPAYISRRADEVMPLLNVVHGTPGARIYLDDELVEVSKYGEYMFSNLPAGKHILAFRTDESEGTLDIFVNPGRKTDSNYDQLEVKMNRGSFVFDVQTQLKDISVYLDNKFLGRTPLSLKLDSGRYSISLRSEWSSTYDEEIFGKTGETIQLKPELKTFGAIVLPIDIPVTASIYINGKQVTQARRKFQLPPADYEIVVEDESMVTYKEKISVLAGSEVALSSAIQFHTGTFIVGPVPFKAELVLDSEPVQLGSFETDVSGRINGKVVVGDHLLTVRNELDEKAAGFSMLVHVEKDAVTTIDIPVGNFVLTGVPESCAVVLNGMNLTEMMIKDPETGGLTSPFLLPGRYEVSVTGPFVEIQTKVIDLTNGSGVNLDMEVPELGAVRVSASGAKNLRGTIRSLDNKVVRTWEYAENQTRILLSEGAYFLELSMSDDIAPGLRERFFIEAGKEIRAQKGSVPYSGEYRLRELQAGQSGLLHDYARLEKKIKRRSRFGWQLFTTGVVGAGVAVGSYVLGAQAFELYSTTQFTSEAQDTRRQMELFCMVLPAAAAVGGLGLVLAPIVWLSRPNIDPLKMDLQEFDDKIKALGLEMGISR